MWIVGIIGATCIPLGAAAVVVAAAGWERFFGAWEGLGLAIMVGRTAARILYAAFGAVLMVIGFLTLIGAVVATALGD